MNNVLRVRSFLSLLLILVFGIDAIADDIRHHVEDNLHGRSPYKFWIGDLGPDKPLFSGPQQYPFICATTDSNLGQPIIDNQNGIGNAVYTIEGDPTSGTAGYSEKCGILTRVDYFYLSTADGKFRLYDADNPPNDMATTMVDGTEVDFIVRVEAGTLNRFLYTIAILAPFPERTTRPQQLNNKAWNGNAIYYFRGGTGIGHWQGEAMWHGGVWRAERTVFPTLLADGYAIMSSSGNESGVHVNLQLAAETAYMVKEHFIETYGEPDKTIGLGGSGGAIQQYALAQNLPGVLDAGIPLISYPDMVTQTIHIADCNLLEQYFLEDVIFKGASSKWATWSNRQWIEGLNTSDTVINMLTGTPGSSQCIQGWYYSEPVVMNPYFTDPAYLQALAFYGYPQEVIDSVRWTHWNDLRNIYGVDPNGFAPAPFDNVGVQYGLQALTDGKITFEEFVEINSCVGSWKEQADYVPFFPSAINPFDSDNMHHDALTCRTGTPQPRRHGDLWAMQAAYLSGHVFRGNSLSIPMIDLRPYLEEILDQHSSRQSFSVRQRLLNGMGNSNNMVIWFTSSEDLSARIVEAVRVVTKVKRKHRPEAYVDSCWDTNGKLIASGENVWNGIIDDKPEGSCTQAYPIYSSSRMVAGDGFAGDMFKCALQSIDSAVTDGVYGNMSLTTTESAVLQSLFPEGVCNYSQPDQGKPEGF